MKAKTIELSNRALDWAVAMAKGIDPSDVYISWSGIFRRLRDDEGNLTNRYMTGPEFIFHKRWESAGPIIQKEGISITKSPDQTYWWAGSLDSKHTAVGTTPLEAAMRCYVLSKIGDEVDVPDELIVG